MSANEKSEFAVRAPLEIRSLGDRPCTSALSLSVLLHGIALALVLLVAYATRPRISPQQYETAQLPPGKSTHLFSPHPTPPRSSAIRSYLHARTAKPAKLPSAQQPSSGATLREQATRQTAAIMKSLKFRAIYGFYPGHDYRLPIRQSGEIPPLSNRQFPNQVAQFVVVEITIDDHGGVADAHIVTGIVEPAIQQIMLAAIREFKYIPAKRDGIPIPSQLDIVVPFPS